MQPGVDAGDGHQGNDAGEEILERSGEAPEIILQRLPQRGGLRIEQLGLLAIGLGPGGGEGGEQKLMRSVSNGQKAEDQHGQGGRVGGRDVLEPIKVGDQMDGQPALVASEDDRGIDGGRQHARHGADGHVLDNVSVRHGRLGRGGRVGGDQGPHQPEG